MQAYPIRGVIYNEIMLLKGLPTSSNVEVLTKHLDGTSLVFKPIDEVQYDECLLLTNGAINGGYLLKNSLSSFQYIQYDPLTDTFSFIERPSPIPLISSSASKLWNSLLTGVVYDLYDIKVRFLPSFLYEGGTLVQKKGQDVLNIEKNITTFNNPSTYYFTNTLDAKENILYKYSYNAECKSYSKGYCNGTLPYTGSIDYTAYGACHLTPKGYQCYTEDYNKVQENNNKLILFVVLIILGVSIAWILVSFRLIDTATSAVYRPELYFDDNNVIDVDAWH